MFKIIFVVIFLVIGVNVWGAPGVIYIIIIGLIMFMVAEFASSGEKGIDQFASAGEKGIDQFTLSGEQGIDRSWLPFLNSTNDKITSSIEWNDLTWDWNEPMKETYLIDHYYPDIIETVLLRRPWSYASDFYSLKDLLPTARTWNSLSYSRDFRCLLGGNLYFDSRFITGVTGPLKFKSDGSFIRAFYVSGYVQSIPFQDETYEAVCSAPFNQMQFGKTVGVYTPGVAIDLPYSDRLHISVGIVEKWIETKKGGQQCQYVSFTIESMLVTPGFSDIYLRTINEKLVADCKKCVWNKMLQQWKEHGRPRFLPYGQQYLYTGKAYMNISAGIDNYVILPRIDWPPHTRIIIEDVAYIIKNTYLHITTSAVSKLQYLLDEDDVVDVLANLYSD